MFKLFTESICVERYGRGMARPKHAALLPVQKELPNEDDDEQATDSISSASGTHQ